MDESKQAEYPHGHQQLEETKDMTPVQSELQQQDKALDEMGNSLSILRSKLAIALSQPDTAQDETAKEAPHQPQSQLLLKLQKNNSRIIALNREIRAMEGLLDL